MRWQQQRAEEAKERGPVPKQERAGHRWRAGRVDLGAGWLQVESGLGCERLGEPLTVPPGFVTG